MAHLVTPLLMCVGMGLAYLGAFAHPAPHHLPVAVVGSSSSAQLLAQSINDKSGGALEARTVPNRSTAVEQLKHQDIFGAYVMNAKAQAQPEGERTQGQMPSHSHSQTQTQTQGESHGQGQGRAQGQGQGEGPEPGSGRSRVQAETGAGTQPRTRGAAVPELLVATAGSDTSASVVQKIFTPLAARQGAPLKVTDVAPPAEDDPTGQGIFFLLVAISIGSYASVAVIGGAGAVLPLRLRAALAIGTSIVVSLIGTAFAGPVFHLIDHGLRGLWGMAWLYSAGVLLIGTGLHTFLKRWTTLGVMALFVMLNFTSSGGIFRPEMQNGFFAALHSFWNGAGFVEGVRSHVYFDGYGLSRHVWTLVGWLFVGVLMVGLAGLAERRRRAVEAETAANAAAVAATVPESRPRRSVGAAARGTGSPNEAAEEDMAEAVGV
ncbi:hypothetical protein JCM4914_37690 [Streptomyces platensis subsp. malvinus]